MDMPLAPAGLIERSHAWESSAGNGVRLRGWRREAAPGEPTLHFLPGNGFAGGVYWPFLRALPASWGLFLHDIEGHGASDAPPRFSGIGALARRIPDVMREQGLLDGRPLIGMGHSFGGAMTLKLAADHPALFRAAVLLDPIAIPPVPWFFWRGSGRFGLNPMARGARRRRTRWASRAEAVERLRGRGIFAGWTGEALDCFVDSATRDEGGARVLCCPPELEAQIYEHPLWTWPAFRAAQVPVLFLHGASSYAFFPRAARLAKRSNPRVRVQTLPGQHCFMQEHPPEAAAAVQRFVADVPR